MDPAKHYYSNGKSETTIHLALPRWDGEYFVACMGEEAQLCAGPGQLVPKLRSADPRLTTCPACKATEAYTAALAAVPLPSSDGGPFEVHFATPLHKGHSLDRPACQDGLSSGPVIRSNWALVVTCPACKETEEFKAALAILEAPAMRRAHV